MTIKSVANNIDELVDTIQKNNGNVIEIIDSQEIIIFIDDFLSDARNRLKINRVLSKKFE